MAIKTDNQKVLIHLLSEYKEIFNHEFDYNKSFKTIRKQIDFNRDKYESLSKKKDDSEPDKFDFESMIIGIELALGVSINRDFKVFQLKSYYEKAIEQNKKE